MSLFLENRFIDAVRQWQRPFSNGQPRQNDQEDHPQRLDPAADVAAAEDVGEDHDHDPDPDHPREEDDHRPEDVEERVIGSDNQLGWLLLRAPGSSEGRSIAGDHSPAADRL